MRINNVFEIQLEIQHQRLRQTLMYQNNTEGA